jgi:soluble lytic murein transglycosylase-like protein
MSRRGVAFVFALAVMAQPVLAADDAARVELDALIVKHAQANDVPEALVRRVIMRESRYDPHVIGSGGAMGLMQIKHATARAMGYTGTASGLLDPDTNLTWAVRYLAGAYRAADGNADRAVSYYAHGYYAEAKRRNMKIYASPADKVPMPLQPRSAEAIY